MDLEDYGIQFDDDGRLVGFQAGKAAALLEWEHRKGAREFVRLCKALYKRKWTAAHREHYNASQRAQRAARAARKLAGLAAAHGPLESAAHKHHRYYLRNKARVLELTKQSQDEFRLEIGEDAYRLHRKLINIRSRAKSKASGKCISCPAKSDGRARCEACRKRDLLTQKRRRDEAIVDGLCSRCKSRRPASGKLDCDRCRAAQARAYKRRAQRARKTAARTKSKMPHTEPQASAA